jgi:hypothetical protein
MCDAWIENLEIILSCQKHIIFIISKALKALLCSKVKFMVGGHFQNKGPRMITEISLAF